MKIFRIVYIFVKYISIYDKQLSKFYMTFLLYIKNLQFKSKIIEFENETKYEINITIYYTHIKYTILQKMSFLYPFFYISNRTYLILSMLNKRFFYITIIFYLLQLFFLHANILFHLSQATVVQIKYPLLCITMPNNRATLTIES